ncbi:MAG: alpha/beta fold hydrolase [Gammaproteobacteria bacterium]|nr:MAG: alpha/beta fold hydrolase [Gammaproteobacteria bacterium]
MLGPRGCLSIVRCPMRKPLLLILLAVLLVVVGPVLLQQARTPAKRSLEGDSLDATRFREVTFTNQAQSIELAGLMFLPRGSGPFPAAVVIHGSGTSKRDNRWYLSLTHYLQDHGIAVLLPDKRGSEQSDGDWRNASFEDLATDSLAAVRFLDEQSGLPISHIGLIGMSQGGWIAPLAAAQSPRVAFVVSVVGSAVSTHRQFLYEEQHNLRQLGMLPGISHLLAYPATSVNRHWVQRDFWSAVGDFDPLPYWSKLDVPSLALYGDLDSNVPSARSAALLRALDNPAIEARIYPGSGHALEDPPGSGNRIFRRDALGDIRDFILASDGRG